MRQEGWESRLAEYLQQAEMRSFAWGDWDCCLFATEVIDLLCGTHLTDEFRGKYHDQESAMAFARELAGAGLKNVCNLIAESHGFKEIPKLFAQRGDICLADLNGETLGVCDGPSFCFCREDGGVFRVALDARVVKTVWHIE